MLWCAVRALHRRYAAAPAPLFVYTGDLDAAPADILKRAKNMFDISLPAEAVRFVYLRRRGWLEATRYPVLTLLGQALGSMWLALEALDQLQPDILVDTMGYQFSSAVFKRLAGCHVASYVHYPTITPEMMRRVSQRTAAHNNRGLIARSPFLTGAKLVYYRLFARAYRWAGAHSDTVMVNSTWTEEHIGTLWGREMTLRTHRVYPPCDVHRLKAIPHRDIDTVRIVSVGQFRPEKEHPLQLRALYELRRLVGEPLWDKITLVFVGSVRGEEDRSRVQDMRDLAKHLALEDNVEFHVNATHDQLLEQLGRALIGLHSMWNEHFGIGVVECMAAGLITIAHRSGGPLTDIIETSEGSRTGFLATTPEEYASAILHVLQLSREQLASLREAARASVDRFTGEEFEKGFLRAVEPMLKPFHMQ